MQKGDLKKWLYWFSLALGIIIIFNLFNNFENIKIMVGNFFKVLSPFLIGILIAYILYLPCSKLERKINKTKSKFIKNHSRGMSIFAIYLIVALLLVLVSKFLFPIIIQSLVELFGNIQGYFSKIMNSVANMPEDSFIKKDIVEKLINQIKQINLNQILNYAKNLFGVASTLINAFVAVVVSIYVLKDRNKLTKSLRKFVRAIFKKDTAERIIKYFYNINDFFFKFLTSQVLDGIIVGILTTIAMMILGVKYALLLGMFIGICNLIPYFGAIFAVASACIITAVTGGIAQAVWMLIVVIILQQIDANIINPKIVGGSLKISPLLVIFAVTIGGAYFGVLGMFLAVPFMTLIKLIIEDFVNSKLKEKQEKQIL